MNKIFREHFPAAKLPDELRGAIDPSRQVTVTVVEEVPPEDVMSLEEIFALRQPPFRTVEEIDGDIRALRDEWQDRG
jgi:hypothetical protein